MGPMLPGIERDYERVLSPSYTRQYLDLMDEALTQGIGTTVSVPKSVPE